MQRKPMSKTGISVTVYGVYLGIMGIGLSFLPNTVLPIFRIDTTNEVWVKLFGFFALILAVKGIYGAILDLVPLMQLACISHQLSAAARDRAASTSLRLLTVLNVRFEYASAR